MARATRGGTLCRDRRASGLEHRAVPDNAAQQLRERRGPCTDVGAGGARERARRASSRHRIARRGDPQRALRRKREAQGDGAHRRQHVLRVPCMLAGCEQRLALRPWRTASSRLARRALQSVGIGAGSPRMAMARKTSRPRAWGCAQAGLEEPACAWAVKLTHDLGASRAPTSDYRND